LESVKDLEKVTTQIAQHITALWASPNIKTAFENRSRFQLSDSANYFFDQIGRLALDNYIPTFEDMLRSRIRTTGIDENDFELSGTKFRMFDVGGQRNERRKWIHFFEDVTAVLFVVALSEYDQLLFEDEKTNRMSEALNLFGEVANSRWFQRSSIILFLNKRDLFLQKIEKSPLTVCPAFSTYSGPQTFDPSVEFIRDHFLNKNKKQDHAIYTHVTCATDQTNVHTVFRAVRDTITRLALEGDGLI